jgi:hypothetical protein
MGRAERIVACQGCHEAVRKAKNILIPSGVWELEFEDN